MADLANILDTEYLSKRDFSYWSHKDGYYALCRIARKAIDISTFEETWKKSLATKKLSPQLVSLLKSRRKATVDDKRRLRKEFLDETAVDSLEEDAIMQGAALLKSGMQYDTRRTKARLESGVKRKRNDDDEEECYEEEQEEQESDDIEVGEKVAADLINNINNEAIRPPSVWPQIKKYLDIVLNTRKEDFKKALEETVNDEHDMFRLYCKKVLSNFYDLVDIFPMIPVSMGERKYIVQNVSPLFTFYERTFGLVYFDWIESHSRAAKLARSPSESGIVKVDANGIRVRDNQEVWHLEVAGSPYIFSTKHAGDNARKSMNLELVTLVAVLREYLSAPIRLAKRLKIFSCQVIGDRITLYSLSLMEEGKFLAEELESAKFPLSFAARIRYIGIFKMMARFHDELMEQEEIIGKIEASLYDSTDESLKVRDVITLPDKVQMLSYK
ncbi:3956_t:CDS:10 [Paraglomus brasilianum]|uniref:3956_t:CDS:1 n=1 Tax=Paraglomus brasilianum TaxID=144538 RepID=A0A9N8W229_9GLOM|nr:3956_t:CDS:10 [Paraglomus brasilianum]